MFAAASNDGLNTLGAFPALYEEVIPVFSANAFGAFSEFNPGQFDRYSFCALGENVKSFWPELPPQDSEYAKYKRLSGTSIATPIVAGIAANLLDFVKRRDSESQDSERLWETVRFRQSGVARAMKVLAREHPDKRKLFYFKFKDLLGKESEGVGDFIWKEIAREFLDY
jgi:subtilisin family serine protease